MSEKLSRKEVKAPDSFSQLSAKAVDFAVNNRKNIIIAVASIFVLIILVALYQEYRAMRNNKASIAFYEAMEQLKTDENKLTLKVEEDFLKVANNFSDTFIGQSARLKLADLYYKSKKYDLAAQMFEKVYKKSASELFKVLALLNMGYIKEQVKDYKTAVTFFKELASSAFDVFQIQAFFGLARCQEKLHEVDNAKTTYNKIISKFPNTEHANMAKKFLSLLNSKNK